MNKKTTPAPAPPTPAPAPYVAEITMRIPLGNRTPAQVEYLQRAASDIAGILAKMLEPANE